MKLFLSLGALINLNTVVKHPVNAVYYWLLGYSYNPKYTPVLIDSACWLAIWILLFVLSNRSWAALRGIFNRILHF